MKLAASGMVLDDKDVFAALKKAAKAEDPDKISQISREGSQEIKWRRLTQDVRTPQLILQVMTDEKVTGDVAKTMQAIAKTLTAKQQPINEDDGEIINMRTATIAAMVKAGVDPKSHFVESRKDCEMVCVCLYDTMRVNNDSLLAENRNSTSVHLGNTITRVGK